MRGISVIVMALVVIGTTVVFLLTFSRITEAILRFLIDIEREAIVNGIGTINLYTALSMGDFYYYGFINPIDTSNFTVESSEKIRLVFLIGNVTTTFNLSERVLTSKAISEHRFPFPKRGVYGSPFKVLPPEYGLEREGIAFIKGMGKEITEYGYPGGAKIVEEIVETCRTNTGREMIVNATLNITIPTNKTIIINGIPYNLEGMGCYLEEGNVIVGDVQKLKFSTTTVNDNTIIHISKVDEE